MRWELSEGSKVGVHLVLEDQGLALPTGSQAMTDGCTSGAGVVGACPGSRRLGNELDIDSEVGRGTRVTIARCR